MSFEFIELDIPQVVLIKPNIFTDERGFFLELYKNSDFIEAGIKEHFIQDNFSRSSKGVLRGLHYQKVPYSQGKLVMCMKGAIFDVAVDIRKSSPFYGKWVRAKLTETEREMLYIPAGFAHGFQVLSETADVLYKCTNEYSSSDDQGIIWNDPEIGISWPLSNPLLSGKDKVHPLLRDADNNFVFRPI